MSSEQARPTIHVAAAPGGWPPPWPSVAELAAALPRDSWTLVGGLMTQLHTVHHGLGILRDTNDVDIVLHIETSRGVPAAPSTPHGGPSIAMPAPRLKQPSASSPPESDAE